AVGQKVPQGNADDNAQAGRQKRLPGGKAQQPQNVRVAQQLEEAPRGIGPRAGLRPEPFQKGRADGQIENEHQQNGRRQKQQQRQQTPPVPAAPAAPDQAAPQGPTC